MTTATVDIGSVDEIAACLHISVEHRKGLLLLERPAEDVATEAQRMDIEIGVCEPRDRLRLAQQRGRLS